MTIEDPIKGMPDGQMHAATRILNFTFEVCLQVANLMLHPEKAVQRSQLFVDRSPAMLCQPSKRSTNPALAAAYGPADASGNAPAEVAERDAESYDDADFYQELLKDLLAGNSSLGTNAADLKQVRFGPAHGAARLYFGLIQLVRTELAST